MQTVFEQGLNVAFGLWSYKSMQSLLKRKKLIQIESLSNELET